jgi:hypothetical protein
MPSSLDHLTQAQANEGFYEELGADNAAKPDWAMTVLFYAALHYAQAGFTYLLAGTAPDTHKARRGAIRTRFRAIADDYEKLYNASCRARYDCISPKREQLRDAKDLLKRIADEIAKTAPPGSYA